MILSCRARRGGEIEDSPLSEGIFLEVFLAALGATGPNARQARRPALYESFSLREGFPGLGDGDQLVPRRLGSTVPRFVQVRDGRARQQDRLRPLLGSARSGRRGACRSPDASKALRARPPELISDANQYLHLFAQCIHARIGMPPRVNQCGLVKRPDRLAHFSELE